MSSLKPRERIAMALDHKEADRCPMHTAYTPEFSARLRSDLESKGTISPSEEGDYVLTQYDLQQAVGNDMFVTFVGWAMSYYQEGATYTDEWGVEWQTVEHNTRFGKGSYTEPVGHPLSEDHAIETYSPPDPNRPELYRPTKEVIEKYQDEYWIVGGVVCTIFETAWALRGLEKTMMDFVNNRDLLKQILDIPFQYHLEAAKELVELGVDMIWTGDDMGGQESMLISPKDWRYFFKPLMARFISELKDINPDVKVAYHSDGDIYPIIPDLIEIGLDVLNPVQPASMDPAELKKDFGEKLSFWGSIDIQQTLPFGTPTSVKEEVIERLQTIGQEGGLIIGPTHYVQVDTPMENFWAMVDTIKNTPYVEL